jgi:hypothetical protein
MDPKPAIRQILPVTKEGSRGKATAFRLPGETTKWLGSRDQFAPQKQRKANLRRKTV